MAVNIDWGLASTPNILGAYTGAREKAEQNVLARQQVEAQAQQRQVENQRADTRLGMDQQKATREQGAADAESWQKAAQAVGHLKTVLGHGGPDAAVAAFDQIAPGLGLPPEQAAQMRAGLAQDPQGFLDHVGALSEQKLQAINRGNGGYDVVDLNNGGNVVRGVEPAPEFKAFKTDENVYQVGGGAPAPAAAPGAPSAGAPRNMRNNNPGNIEDGPFAQSLPGYKGSDGRFAIFDDPKAGGQAQVALLGSYGRRGINTVQDAISRWAPASDGNDPVAYAKFVSDKIGVKPGQKIDLTDPVIASDMASAIQQFEGGGQSKSNAAPGGPQLVQAATPKPASDRAPVGYQFKPDGSLAFIPGGPADPATKTSAGLKPVPSKIQSGYADNAKGMTQIDQAIAAIKGNPAALGGSLGGFIRNKMGDDVSQRVDPGGVDTRAALANIGSLLIHDRSGAAVTAAETPRLLPFIPQVTDTPEAAVKKLQGLKAQYENANSQIEVQFGEESGYRPIAAGGKPAPAKAAPAAQAKPARPAPPQRGQVVKGYRYNGGPPGDPKSWSKAT